MPVFDLVEDGALEAWIGIPASMWQRIRKGEPHRLLVLDQYYEARVIGPLPELDAATRTRTVVFRFEPSAAASLVPEQVVRVQLTRTVPTDGFWIPISALTAAPRGLWDCYTVTEGRAEHRSVELLHTDGERALVRGTIGDGEQIISDGAHRIVEGQRVRPIVSDQPGD